jgi:hypothetical protein
VESTPPDLTPDSPEVTDAPTSVDELDPATREATYREVTRVLWKQGSLRYKLHETQCKIYDALQASSEKEFYLLCSRRLGKTYMLMCLAFELAIRKPGSRILFLAPYAKDAEIIATDMAATLLQDCPADLKPKYNSQLKTFTFEHTGSLIRLKGVNSEAAQFLRGGAADLVILDECGIMDDLQHVLDSVVAPMTLTTKGRILLATTPPRSPGHDSKGIYEKLAGKSATAVFTIRDAPHISYEDKVKELERLGEATERIPGILAGELAAETTSAQREFFCKFVTDANTAVIPEWNEARRKKIVIPTKRPAYFDAYVSIDPGFNDRTGILYGYWDFSDGKLVIEDESLLHKASTWDIAEEILKKEYELWSDKKPFLRVSDVDPRLVADLWERHQIGVMATEKQDSLGAINLVRNMVKSDELRISSKCVHLPRQIENATWNTKATDFERAGESSPDGHYDLLAALKYLCRNINRHRNPYPDGYGRVSSPHQHISPRKRFWSQARKLGLLDDTPYGRRKAGVVKK